jgi:hypothetical protein
MLNETGIGLDLRKISMHKHQIMCTHFITVINVISQLVHRNQPAKYLLQSLCGRHRILNLISDLAEVGQTDLYQLS